MLTVQAVLPAPGPGCKGASLEKAPNFKHYQHDVAKARLTFLRTNALAGEKHYIKVDGLGYTFMAIEGKQVDLQPTGTYNPAGDSVYQQPATQVHLLQSLYGTVPYGVVCTKCTDRTMCTACTVCAVCTVGTICTVCTE